MTSLRRRAGVLLATLVLATTGAVATASPAHAGTCWENGGVGGIGYGVVCDDPPPMLYAAVVHCQQWEYGPYVTVYGPQVSYGEWTFAWCPSGYFVSIPEVHYYLYY